MVNRMKPLLPHLIDDYQNAFVPGRQIDDNILISHEMMHIINKQCSGSLYLAALTIDMNKAYDRVSWLFLLKILTTYGFPQNGSIWYNNVFQRFLTGLLLMVLQLGLSNQSVVYVKETPYLLIYFKSNENVGLDVRNSKSRMKWRLRVKNSWREEEEKR